MYLTSASISASNKAFSLSAIAKKRLRMEWISVNVSELHRLDNGAMLGVLNVNGTVRFVNSILIDELQRLGLHGLITNLFLLLPF